MGCGLRGEGELDLLEHWTTLPGARMERAGLRADCPGCGKHRGLSAQVKGRYVSWNLPACMCDRDEVRPKLAAALPGCLSVRYTPRTAVNRDALIALMLDKSLPPVALRVAALQALGMRTPEIRSKLGLSRQRWSEVVRITGQNRRSALPGTCPDFRTAPAPQCPDFRTEPQVKGCLMGLK